MQLNKVDFLRKIQLDWLSYSVYYTYVFNLYSHYTTQRKDVQGMYKISKQKLSVAMLDAGIETSKQLAALSGVSVNTISRFNNGGSVKLPTLQALATVLHVTPAELIEEAR